jgi:hypothetical protein
MLAASTVQERESTSHRATVSMEILKKPSCTLRVVDGAVVSLTIQSLPAVSIGQRLTSGHQTDGKTPMIMTTCLELTLLKTNSSPIGTASSLNIVMGDVTRAIKINQYW